MHVLVTGAAGFIGSHVVERLLADGHAVTAVDDFDPYYDRAIKERNAAGWRDRVRFLELDLAAADLAPAFEGVDHVVHLAARAGVRGAWGPAFGTYLASNVQATQRLLEFGKTRDLSLFLYGGSASVYGDDATGAVTEDYHPLRPHSAYGVTKLAGEHLCETYRRVFGVPTATGRIFSCYGPRERPDKAIQIFLTAARTGAPVTVHGDGAQLRDFTYVGDIVDGLVGMLEARPVGETLNLARGATRPLSDVLGIIQDVTGGALEVAHGPPMPGDVRVTSGDIGRARARIGYDPQVSLETGIARQWAHVQATTP